MKQVNLYEAKTHLSRLVDEAAGGAEIVIAKDGKPLAALVPLARVQAPAPRRFGQLAGKWSVPADDIGPDPDIAKLFDGHG
ncbi:type II toxin-antitoxin system Phd/YefM family antitoxin [Zavarzinia sp. CC-PAN008]|uniref:type II toxin-antitoxin system Phd/YefM family antitoxin n=1 Tax=Zavarzinia sp. CC-PAN008 TaxID=3243332 RepID=UPI003F743B0F